MRGAAAGSTIGSSPKLDSARPNSKHRKAFHSNNKDFFEGDYDDLVIDSGAFNTSFSLVLDG